MNVKIVRSTNGQPEWAMIPYQDYLRMVEKAEMLDDIRAYDSAKEALDRGEEELIPEEVVYALLDGMNPIRVWREYRGFSQQELADRAGISKAYLSQLETGKRQGTLKVLAAIAHVLGVDIDDLLPNSS